MSLITKQNRISVKPFATLPPLLEIPAISPPTPSVSVSDVSSRWGAETAPGVDLAEGCLLTKAVKYTHRIVSWVDCACSGDSRLIEELIDELGICHLAEFKIDKPCNLSFLESYIHTSLNDFAFIAVTASSSTLEGLISLLQDDNNMRQQKIDDYGDVYSRSPDVFSSPYIRDPMLELVALHPHHFLPLGSALTIYDPASCTLKNYFAAEDNCLRESPKAHSPRLPPFRHTGLRHPLGYPNVFLIALNAEIKFRRYFRRTQQSSPLPDDVVALMRRTMDLVDLIYWIPVPKKGSPGEEIVAERMGLEVGDTDDIQERYWSWITARHREDRQETRAFRNMDPEQRKAYVTALIAGPDADYWPYNESLGPTSTASLYSDKSNVDAWMNDINP
ncbi:hypothetical protein Hypma_002215 [Hypsizygus marmoreus]|uniref:Uncharacterized protein n=1 Tax=Hypsizygus marmoreus TaxID=39966 RepID=A0A369K7X3_HYPMA|nr:hypothetical protein Hypma_002215 [Hypsizygus marmoreus]